MESLLVNVSKYASSDKKSPRENFITEAFAWLLRNDPFVRKSIAALLQSKGIDRGLDLSINDNPHHIETQVNFGGKYPDMLWSSEDRTFCIVFEHKVGSELHGDQIDNYRQYADEKLGMDFKIVLITAHTEQHAQNPDLALCWYQIAEEIEKVNCGNEKNEWIRQEFIHLLKSNNLTSVSPINPLSIYYYNDAKKIDEQLYTIAKRTVEREWPIKEGVGYISYNQPAFQRGQRNGKHDVWGRIGLEFNNVTQEYQEGGWNPGVFCGFLIDGKDHCMDDLMEDGPLAVLILDIDKSLHQEVKVSSHYKALVEKVVLPAGWHLSDRTTKSRKENPWHPLVFYRRLSDFIENAVTLEQQIEAFFSQMSELQQVLLDCDSFVLFCEEMHRRYEEIKLPQSNNTPME